MEDRLRIAVFIDFDNIEIGVKNTLGRNFDVSAVLEAMKERGEILTKIAYADWTRQGSLSRNMTQHAVQMVQRHPSPRGDKNGADINLALDALEMALTKPHIDAFAIVSGDSDFISLVEKLKQYNKTVFIVGGELSPAPFCRKTAGNLSVTRAFWRPLPPDGAEGRSELRNCRLPFPSRTSLLWLSGLWKCLPGGRCNRSWDC